MHIDKRNTKYSHRMNLLMRKELTSGAGVPATPARPALRSLLLLASLANTLMFTHAAAAEAMTDEKMERFLLEAKVVGAKELGTGITKPHRLTLELDGKTIYAAFKDVDVFKPGVTRFPGGKTEMNFTDKYIYEIAAYRLDRRLGMNMVPVAVVRKWNGKSGSFVEWIDCAIAENQRIEQGIEPPDPVAIDYQKAVMRLFDALIYNVDRNQTNMLFRKSDWKLFLIDHTRSFRQIKKLPKAFAENPKSLPRDLLTQLESLGAAELKTLLKNVATGPQIKSLLLRRDQILVEIAEDRESYGDNMVFQD